MSNEIIFSNHKYKQWIAEVSVRFKRSQIKAASKINEEMLFFYWELGRDIENIKSENVYGSNFYERLSADLTKELPEVKSFSPRNLRYMKEFYCLYANDFICQQSQEEGLDSNLQQLVTNLELEIIFKSPYNRRTHL